MPVIAALWRVQRPIRRAAFQLHKILRPKMLTYRETAMRWPSTTPKPQLRLRLHRLLLTLPQLRGRDNRKRDSPALRIRPSSRSYGVDSPDSGLGCGRFTV
ncbi:hypothetical protein H113_03494 [Trichophyton rubrum MR1459]|uniref:Uncharacterized protein n=1 Tax=Trichophyton rubrum (strain ATCC MYA-4607 / CBS 118892) TaxID=559305 RepID=F2SQD2_TRIRC|nr:uncharacterized protein TERG_04795 [Trichophyton rubrum CBS 118892]EGD88550.2 hypothetical protein TERG_04795 [Trichophyton rubrum CBS 118892]EZF96295.1 hypothetical protein H113_03494 [Trichophyton rubrum MR1459]EZG07155.1 hypothetical protein H106_03284 [Trichophyton rubrum CBS 735.88]